MRASVTLGTADLRAALNAVRVHASTTSDSDWHAIRLAVDDQNVTVTAGDRFTLGLSIVSVVDHDRQGPYVFELLPDDVAKVLGIFTAGKESPASDAPEYLVRIDTDDESVTVVDCSGMLDGRALKVPRLPTSTTLNAVPRIIIRAHSTGLVLLEDLVFQGEYVARFKAAATAYRETLTFEAHEGTKGLLVRCGESFLGALMPITVLPEHAARIGEWRDGWDRRLPAILAAVDADGAT
ncbi:hypothetical protein [Nocardia altamirensis]|uniref:hypothetical protein n=1 Tax=Nocardia altamirensis TaxID=472158 RepID=UPI0008404CFF|nr:hypothetical protein [Nocardia altamirensis]